MTKKIIGAREDKKGNIKEVQFEGNKTFTKIEKAIDMAKAGKIENVNVSTSKNGTKYIRKNPNGSKADNVDTLAKK